MAEDCPECGSQLRARRPNFLRNIRRREIENRYDRYVCPSCETTFSREEIVELRDESISIKQWMEGATDGGKRMRDGKFIVVEGLDGSGKTGVVEAIADEFEAATTAEPSEFWTGKQVRRALQEDTPAFTDFFLFMADRHYHIEEFIKPRVEAGEIVVSDRFSDSTLAYQPVQLQDELGDPVEWMSEVMAPWNFMPDLTIYLDVTVETGLERADKDEKYENKEMLEQVKENYEFLIQRDVDHPRYIVVDAEEQSEDEVQQEVIEIVRGELQ